MSRLPRQGFLALGYLGLVGFLWLESSSRRDTAVPDLNEDDDDGTTRQIVVAYVASAAAAPLLAKLPQPRLGRGYAVLGLATEVAGLLVRRRSMDLLGASYTRTLRTTDAQALVTEGPYGVIRHPGYLGSILAWIGFGLTSRSPAAVGFIVAVMSNAYARRITAEERVLERDIDGYAAYRRRTYRLVPFIW